MEPVPQALLELIKKTAPPESAIVPLSWAFEDEEYNIAIVMPDTVECLEARHIEGRVRDVAMDWDAAHGTVTLCKVWRQYEIARPGVL